jgi:D-alanyl-D-alanine carboxypeptidase
MFVVVLGTTSAAERVRISGILLNDAFEQTENVQLLTANQPLARFKIWEGVQKELTLNAPYSVFTTIANPNYIPPAQPALTAPNTAATDNQPLQIIKASTTLTSVKPVSYQLSLINTPVVAPLTSQQTLGTLKISYNNQPVTTVELHPQANVQEAGFFERLWDKVTLWYAQLRHTISQPEKLILTNQV